MSGSGDPTSFAFCGSRRLVGSCSLRLSLISARPCLRAFGHTWAHLGRGVLWTLLWPGFPGDSAHTQKQPQRPGQILAWATQRAGDHPGLGIREYNGR